jgi:hypothetical protein
MVMNMIKYHNVLLHLLSKSGQLNIQWKTNLFKQNNVLLLLLLLFNFKI